MFNRYKTKQNAMVEFKYNPKLIDWMKGKRTTKSLVQPGQKIG